MATQTLRKEDPWPKWRFGVGLYCVVLSILVNIPTALALFRFSIDEFWALCWHAPNQFIFCGIFVPICALGLYHTIRLTIGSARCSRCWVFGTSLAALFLAAPIAIADHQSDQPDIYVAHSPFAEAGIAELQTIQAMPRHTRLDKHALIQTEWYQSKRAEATLQRQSFPLALEEAYFLGNNKHLPAYLLELIELIAGVHLIVWLSFLLVSVLLSCLLRNTAVVARSVVVERLAFPLALCLLSGVAFTAMRAHNMEMISLIKGPLTSVPPGIMLLAAFVIGMQWLVLWIIFVAKINRILIGMVSVLMFTALSVVLLHNQYGHFLSGTTGLTNHRTGLAISLLTIGTLVEITLGLWIYRQQSHRKPQLPSF